MNTLFQLEEISFTYGSKTILDRISLTINLGEVVTLLGPNGSGKTTLMKILLGLLQPCEGRIVFQGGRLESIPRRELARQLAYVPQVHRDAFPYTVEEVVLMGRMAYQSFFSNYSQEDHRIATKAIARMGLSALQHRPYTEISGGERQLTLIARAMAQGASVFIMDEPVNGLDYGNQLRLLERIRLLTDKGYTFILTTHYPDHALHTADRAILLKNGRIIADGMPQRTITSDTIKSLYDIDVRVLVVYGGGRVCVPPWRS